MTTMRFLGMATALALLAATTTTAIAQSQFQAVLNNLQVVSTTSTSTGTGLATFTLSPDETQLSYSLQLIGMDLDATPANRTAPEDVTAIHFHNGAIGTAGPHVLNVFGPPSEDDGDLSIDFSAESLSGIWDDGDVLPGSDQSAGGTTKFLSNFITELRAGELYVAVHQPDGTTAAGSVAIRGQILAIPEPTSIALLLVSGIALAARPRRVSSRGEL